MDSEAVSQHYNERKEKGRKERESSRIIRLRKFNNWVKSVLIQLHTRPGYSILDLACGRGGDLPKWAKAKIAFYVGCDVAHKSLQHAVERYNEAHNITFPATLLYGDCFEVRLSDFLPDDVKFDVVSCQFAVHYAFEKEKRIRQMLENVSDRLKPGGFFIGTTTDANVLVRKLRAVDGFEFGNSVFGVSFDGQTKRFPQKSPWGIRYRFTLDNNIEDCPEFLVHFPSFQEIAREYGLDLKFYMNFHDFYLDMTKDERFRELFQRMCVTGNQGMTVDEWDAVYLYCAYVFQRVGGRPYEGVDPQKVTPVQMKMEPEDIIMMQHGE